MNDVAGSPNESSFNRNQRLARDNQYERAHHRRVMMFCLLLVAVTLFGLYRTQESMKRSERAANHAALLSQENRRLTLELMELRDALANTCTARSMHRTVLRQHLLEDEDTSAELRELVEVSPDFAPITC